MLQLTTLFATPFICITSSLYETIKISNFKRGHHTCIKGVLIELPWTCKNELSVSVKGGVLLYLQLKILMGKSPLKSTSPLLMFLIIDNPSVFVPP